MYCPICFNDSLKIASSGVIRLTFDGKAKSTSQFYYNTKQESLDDIMQKLADVIEDYFKWYSTFQNKSPIKDIQAFSSDFVCSTGCKLNINNKLNVVNVLIDKQALKDIVSKISTKHNIPVEKSAI